MSCEEVRRWIARPGGIEGGSLQEFEAADRHLDGCAACAAYLRERDPLAQFRRLAEDAPPGEFWNGFWDGVRGGVHEAGRLGPWESLGLLRPAYRAVMAAVVVVAAGILAFSTLHRTEPVPPPEITMDYFPVPSVGPSPVPTVESIGSTEARITDVKVFGDAGEVTEVVMIFDNGIDL